MAMAAAQAITCSCSCNGLGSSSTSSTTSRRDRIALRSDFLGAQNNGVVRRVALRTRHETPSAGPSPGAVSIVPIRAAISREKKEATVEKARVQLEGAYLVAAIEYSGLSVKQFEKLRRALPEQTTLFVAKNKLIGKAIEGTKWEGLKPVLKGMNAWLFVHSEEIPAALKPYRDIQKEFKLETDFTGAVFEGKFYAPSEFKQLESMPTRAELFSKLLGGIQTPATNLVGTLQAPARDLVLTLKAYVAKLEEESGQGPQ